MTKIKVCVIGAGKMGLPLACKFAERGAEVIACDANAKVVDLLNQGKAHFEEPGIDAVLDSMVKKGRLQASTDTKASVAESDVVVVIVPVVLTSEKQADMKIIRSVAAQIGQSMKPGTLVSFETTLPVGGTRSMLKELEAKGLKAGIDFDLAFSPERVKSGSVMEKLGQTPKIVGGINAKSTKRAADFYSNYLGVEAMTVDSMEASELVKLAGMLYRDVNIALSNELSRYADLLGINILQVIARANTCGESQILTPGLGVGGHCTPVYPYFVTKDAREKGMPMRLAEESRQINDLQPGYLLDQIEKRWHDSLAGKDVLILGLSFRPNVKETYCSPAFLLQKELLKKGAQVFLHDPLYSDDEINSYGFEPRNLEGKLPQVIVLNTMNDNYLKFDFSDMNKRGLAVFLDGRNVFKIDEVTKSGVVYIGVGTNNDTATEKAKEQIQIARPQLDEAETFATAKVIESGWIMQGPEVALLEKEFAAYTDSKFACALSSGTAALHLALLAIGVEPEDEVITVSHSFIATANSIRYCGAIPVFVDIDPSTFNMDVELLEKAITPKTKAILCVHQMGMPCDMKRILEIARKYELFVVEDAACAAGSEILFDGKWEKIGKPHGDIACFSFHPRKILTTGDGGMVTTNNREWDEKIRIMRNHGLSLKTPNVYETLGYNYRMTDIQAAVGRKQLEKLDSIVTARRKLAETYSQLLDGSEFLAPHEPSWARSNWQSFCLRLAPGLNQQAVLKALEENEIAAKSGIMNAHQEPAYKNEKWRTGCNSLSKSTEARDQSVIVPLYHQMKEETLIRIVATLKSANKTNLVI